MRSLSQALWTGIGLCAFPSAATAASGVFEASLVFPRNNTAYEPSANFPIVFALQNQQWTKDIWPMFNRIILNTTNQPERTRVFKDDSTFNYTGVEVVSSSQDYDAGAGWGDSDPYFLWYYVDLQREGPLSLLWWFEWESCEKIDGRNMLVMNEPPYLSTIFPMEFEIKKGGQKIDLVAATDEDENDCSVDGMAIEMTGSVVNGSWLIGDYYDPTTCVLQGTSTPTPTAHPCRVKIDKATVESMHAEDLKRACRGAPSPFDCPDEDHAAHMVAASGFATLFAAAIGAGLLLF